MQNGVENADRLRALAENVLHIGFQLRQILGAPGRVGHPVMHGRTHDIDQHRPVGGGELDHGEENLHRHDLGEFRDEFALALRLQLLNALADRVRTGDIAYSAAVEQGMYRPLGSGDADIAKIIRSLEAAGYTGWYVLEQDTVLSEEPPDGPPADVLASVAFVRELAP